MRIEPVRIGIVGCGAVATGAYRQAVEQLATRGLAEVVALCDARPERRAQAYASYGEVWFTDDYRALVASPEVELVLVLTSMPEHGAVAAAALEAGRHVLVEKPMATTLAEAARLVELAKRGPGHLVPAPAVTLSATYRAMQRHILGGSVGQVSLARARYGHGGPTWGPWFYREGGGPLFDLGVYNITTLTGLLGPARRVTAMGGVAQPERVVDGQRIAVEVEDSLQVLIEFAGGGFGVVTTGFTMQRYRTPAVEVYGTAGTIQLMGNDFAPEGYELWQNSVGMWQVSEKLDRAWSWTDGLGHLVECIRSGARPAITPEHGYHVLEIMVRALESARGAGALPVESTFAPHRWEE